MTLFKESLRCLMQPAAFLMLLALLFLPPAGPAYGQNPFTGDVTLTSQAEVDAWPGYTQITGNLTIQGADIADISGLSTLTELDGDLTVTDNPLLGDCSALFNLLETAGILDPTDGVAGTTTIANNQPGGWCTLNGIRGFYPGQVNLRRQSDVDAFVANAPPGGWREIQGHLNVSSVFIPENEKVNDLSGLSTLTRVGLGEVIIARTALTSLAGLENLTIVHFSMRLEGNASLTDLTGWGNLTVPRLDVRDNPSLTSLVGLENVVIEDDLDIRYNDALTSLAGLENLTSLDDNLTVTDNPLLGDCSALYTLISTNGVAGTTTVANNQPGGGATPRRISSSSTRLPKSRRWACRLARCRSATRRPSASSSLILTSATATPARLTTATAPLRTA